MLKCILTHEDAKLAADYGIDGIIVSNHSGRVVDSGRATIEVLPEIIEVAAAACRCSWTAAFVAAQISSRL
jgi:isopentenyl diphosphate isomerase/L-lactate dehydrogenase-like FMN-dependent dehydrogenase